MLLDVTRILLARNLPTHVNSRAISDPSSHGNNYHRVNDVSWWKMHIDTHVLHTIANAVEAPQPPVRESMSRKH
jgi:hypothetical protein